MRVLRRFLLLASVASAVWAGYQALSRRRAAGSRERRAEPDPEALAMAGQEADGRVGVDVQKLQELEMTPYKPLVGYLTAIQVQRGEDQSTLLFVRRRDLDALAELAGEDRNQFLDHLREMGILLSMN